MFIYKQYTPSALDAQFNNRLRVPGYAANFERWEHWSRQTEIKYSPVKDIAYGSHGRERLDIYPSQQPKSKILIFIHGGYWKSMSKESFHFVADGFRSYGITTVLVEYPLMPEASMEQLVASCAKAIKWVRQNIASYNGNSEQIYIAGHSAGGHLAAMMMTAEAHNPPVQNHGIKGICTLSGLFNLAPVRLSYLNDDLQMDEPTVNRNSPIRLMPVIVGPLLLVVGAEESEEFKDQSLELYNNWNKQIPLQLVQSPGLNHFSIVEAFADKSSVLHSAICTMMEL
jgi:arylformamidase